MNPSEGNRLGEGIEAIEMLMDRGLLTPDQSIPLESMVRKGVSYKDYVITHVGTALGTLYLKEEWAEHLVLHALDLQFDALSVPEFYVLEDDITFEPWHREKFATSSVMEQFCMEAAEPWHVSLRERWKPLNTIVEWFRSHPAYDDHRSEIIKKAYE